MNTFVEFYGVKIDSRCKAFLNIAINSPEPLERYNAIEELGKLGCNIALSIVAKKSPDPLERMHTATSHWW